MGAAEQSNVARAVLEEGDGGARLRIGGRWRLTADRPRWAKVRAGRKPGRLTVELEAGERWDSALGLFLAEVTEWAETEGVAVTWGAGVPAAVPPMVAELRVAERECHPEDRSPGFVVALGLAATDVWVKTKGIMTFVGECTLSVVAAAKRPDRLRWRDYLHEAQQCGAMALPIVSLIGILMGVILAYQAAAVLRQFGADIYVADLVGIAVFREMGPLMTAMILAGRTGAAFAAQLGNMKANEEIDALATLGIRPVDFLVLPRLVALGVMTPLLTLYADFLGILGGMIIAMTVVDIPPTAYIVEMQTIVDLGDIAGGLVKAATYGGLIGLAGCLRGLQAERSAAGVGQAATSAVVTSILLIVVANAIFAVAFNLLGI